MNAITPHTEPETFPILHTQDALHFRDILVEMVDLGARLVRNLVHQAEAQPASPTPEPRAEPEPDPTIPYARVTRSIRRSILLCQKLTDPAPARAQDASDARRVAARKQIIRAVEDSIHQDASAAEAGDLHAELHERLEGPEFDADLDDQRPAVEIINQIRADLGIHGPNSRHNFKRRTPQDIAILCERAAAPRPAQAGPYNLPMPPRGWTGRDRAAPPTEPDPKLRE